MPVLLPDASLQRVSRIPVLAGPCHQVPGVEVASAAGKRRAETATDPAPVEMIETTIMLKPEFLPPTGCCLECRFYERSGNPAGARE